MPTLCHLYHETRKTTSLGAVVGWHGKEYMSTYLHHESVSYISASSLRGKILIDRITLSFCDFIRVNTCKIRTSFSPCVHPHELPSFPTASVLVSSERTSAAPAVPNAVREARVSESEYLATPSNII